jgi:hypothetical protein
MEMIWANSEELSSRCFATADSLSVPASPKTDAE